MAIRRGTTPTIRVLCGEDVDLASYKWTLSLQDIELNAVHVPDDRINKGQGYLEATLTQEETLSLVPPRAYVQLNGADEKGIVRVSTQIMETLVQDNLYGEVL